MARRGWSRSKMADAILNLANAGSNGAVRVIRVDAAGSDAIRVKRMGICEGRELRFVQNGDPMILLVSGARVGLSRQLASQVVVECVDARESRRPA